VRVSRKPPKGAVGMETRATDASAFEFTGRGSEYFRIWIVNLVLTIVTLGIYSAWAKVRRLQYFYRNTSLLGASFDYHANPIAILKGRLIGVGLLIGYQVASNTSPLIAVIAFAALLVVLPWLLQRSLVFKLVNSSYRGLRFRFMGSVGDAYRVFLLWPLLGYVTLGLLFPIAHQRIKAYQHGNSLFASSAFGFSAKVNDFYRIYLKLFGLMLVPLTVMGIVLGSLNFASFSAEGGRDPGELGRTMMQVFFALMVFYLVIFLLIAPWFSARMQNLVWNHTALGSHTFESHVRARDLLAIYLTNFVAIVLTLGLFKPFADIRLARYRLFHMGLRTQGDIEALLAAEQQSVGALGQETADVFDVDISF